MRGLYWFSVSIMARNDRSARVVLEVNGVTVVGAAQVNYGDAVSAILMLEIGDRVTCLKPNDGHYLWEWTDDWTENIFSGYLYTEL